MKYTTIYTIYDIKQIQTYLYLEPTEKRLNVTKY